MTVPNVSWIGRWRVEAGELLVWWLQELRELTDALLSRLAPRWVTHTLVRLEGAGASVWLVRGAHRERVGDFTCDAQGNWPEKLTPPEAAAAIHGTKAIIALPAEQVLTHRLSLPAAVDHDLEQVVRLQLERECPMPLDRVYVDRAVRRHPRRDQKIDIDVLIVQRDRIERLRALAKGWGLRLTRIGMSGNAAPVVGNFLRKPTTLIRLEFTRTDRRLVVSAVILAAVCAGVIACQWGSERILVGRKLRSLEAPAASAERLTRQLEKEALPGEALVGLMRQPDAVDALITLTADIPKDSWVYELDVSAQWPQLPQLKLAGFTPVATMLVGVLGNAGRYDNVRLVSAMSAGLGSAQDRLQLTARLSNSTGSDRKGGRLPTTVTSHAR
jgi:general secretion pathway protein L